MKQNIAEFTEQFGIILFVENFDECEKFYAETIGLQVLNRAKTLTRFEFGNAYLMLEGEDSHSHNATRGSFVIRFNPLLVRRRGSPLAAYYLLITSEPPFTLRRA